MGNTWITDLSHFLGIEHSNNQLFILDTIWKNLELDLPLCFTLKRKQAYHFFQYGFDILAMPEVGITYRGRLFDFNIISDSYNN
jgi:hypothetical protein